MIRNIKLTVQYDGTHYAGWQFQKNASTIQEVLSETIERITGRKVSLIGSGRTDSGVHAKAQVANFKTYSAILLKKMRMALNSNLPEDIVVTRIEEVDIKFNAQRDARSKLYRYTIFNGNFVDPFIRRYVSKCFYKLDLNAMRRASKGLLGRHDFKSFQAKDGRERNSIRTIKSIKIEKEGNLVYIYVEADGFLYNMVRNIAGTLIEIGRGKMREEIGQILKKKDRRFSGPTAPAQGLCLLKVSY